VKPKYTAIQDLTNNWTERFGAASDNVGEFESVGSRIYTLFNDSISTFLKDPFCPVVFCVSAA
jgi:hypothetical protein